MVSWQDVADSLQQAISQSTASTTTIQPISITPEAVDQIAGGWKVMMVSEQAAGAVAGLRLSVANQGRTVEWYTGGTKVLILQNIGSLYNTDKHIADGLIAIFGAKSFTAYREVYQGIRGPSVWVQFSKPQTTKKAAVSAQIIINPSSHAAPTPTQPAPHDNLRLLLLCSLSSNASSN